MFNMEMKVQIHERLLSLDFVWLRAWKKRKNKAKK